MKYPSPIGTWKVSSPYGNRFHPISGTYKMHFGTDLITPSGTLILAPFDGVVDDAAIRDNACGGTLAITHEKMNSRSRYCHLKEIRVKKGDKVRKGQIVGRTGGGANDIGKGRSTGPHLHFEYKVNGQIVDPNDYFEEGVISKITRATKYVAIAGAVGMAILIIVSLKKK